MLDSVVSGVKDFLCPSGHIYLTTRCRIETIPAQAFQPFVSIVVPVYNRAGEIGSCFESLLNLDYPRSKCEIIVVGDASDDGTHTNAHSKK
jgi:cellulose synthase/poly-beta-1,6-N-acetylglucosamine synthase-like glycosyltransferase